ncbi:MAG TPA: protein kinase [Terriglobia bacterium]|nr:protein kinase [Terriglobia bacterium]
MDSNRWEIIQTLFHGAADLPESERPAFLKNACADDESLIAEVLALLEEDAQSHAVLDRDLAHVAQDVFAAEIPPAPRFQQIGPYRILKVLGEGGMGVVYLAERGDLHSVVAIKLLRDAWLSPARRERFSSEQRTLAQLNHPGIARLYDAGTLDDGTPWFAMEYVDGIPLADYCRRNQSSTGQRLQLFRAVCEAVQYAHQQAVIHRDLKDSNILVKSEGNPRLLDFGIAKQLESFDTPADQTRTGLRLMTPAYAAPEQIRGERVGVQADVYALGVILYELVAGRLPFDLTARTPAEAAAIVTEQEPVKPSVVVRPTAGAGARDSVSKTEWADLDVLCLTAMHKDPARRYPSVEALTRDIDHYLKGEPLEARPDTLGYRLGKFLVRRRRPVAAAAAAFAFVVGLVIFFTLRLASERDHANRQTAIATAVNRFLSDDLLGRGDPFQSGKADESLVDAIRQASPGIDHKFADAPEVAARLHLTIARALDNRSNFSDARQEFERAHALFLETGGPLSEDAVAVQLQRAVMEARSFQPQGIATAKSLVAAQEPLLARIPHPRAELKVWLLTAKGLIALVESDAKSANHYFEEAVDASSRAPELDEIARFNLRQRLAFTYIRLGDGATAERLARQLIAAYSSLKGPDSPYVLRVRLNLAQAFMIERKFPEAVQEANEIYPIFLSKLGPDHELTMQLLATRAQSEGSLGQFDDSVRDDLIIYNAAVKKQGPLAFYSIATLSDASVGQCRADHFADGERSARQAHEASVKAFGPRSALAEGTALPWANCLIGLGRLDDASRLLEGIDGKVVAELTGDPDWGAAVSLAQAEIALRQGRLVEARKSLESARPAFSRPDAEAYQKRKLDELSEMIYHRPPSQ